MKKLLSVLLVVAMVLGMLPVMASAAETATAAPSIDKVSMTLNGILDVNFKVSANGADMSGYSLKVTIGDDADSQLISDSTISGDYYVYTAKLPAHRLPETLSVSLVSGETAVQSIEWTAQSYLDTLAANASTSDELKALCEALGNYGVYAAAYAAGEVASIAAVEAVVASDLDAYKHSVSVKNGTGLKPVTSLYLDDACDLRIKFNAEAFDESILYIDGTAVEMTVEDDLTVYAICELVPQDWGHLYDIKVVDGEEVTFQCSYSVLSYACINLAKEAEVATGLNGLLKAMSLYSIASSAYNASVQLPDDDLVDKLYGGWLGQMIGVDRGFPNEFNNNATLVDDSQITALSAVDPSNALGQDDLYVEIPFLQAMSEHGYNCDGAYLAESFAATTFGLWHANKWGRLNLQSGIEYPDSGSYLYNQCAEDIDWQIESDFIGMMYPGMPSAAAAKAFELGHIMNYGDGVYGGVFVAAMHAQAYTAGSLDEIWMAGIQVIPEGTQFRALLDDVLANYEAGMSFESNWAAINEKWIPTAMCFAERNGCTIDAKLNSGYVLMALLYASSEEGVYNQLDKATYYAIKCGMDTDCNASTAASVLGNYYGYEALKEATGYSMPSGTFSETSVTVSEAIEMNLDLMSAVLAEHSTVESVITPVAYEQVPDGVYVYLNNLDAPNGRNLHLNNVVIRCKNAEPVSYEVNYGDGTVHTGSYYQSTHIYTADGTYTVAFTVYDSLGQSHTGTTTVTVNATSNTYTGISSLSEITDLSGSYVLTGNITGNTTTVSGFTGKLDGNGYTVETTVPLFNGIDSSSAMVENLKIVLTSDLYGNGILSSAQINWALIENVDITAANGARLIATDTAGALAPCAAYASFVECTNAVQVLGVNYTGGILGTVQKVDLYACSNSGAISGAEAGGIIGRSTWETNTVVGCSNTGTVTVDASSTSDYPAAGGIVGRIVFGTLTVTDCTNKGAITSAGHYAGGMIGYMDNGAAATIIGSINSGAVNAAQMAGGIAGWANYTNITIYGCVNYGVITASMSGYSNMEAGGIIARSQVNTATIENCNNYGRVIGWRSGGIGAYAHGGTVTVTNCNNYGESRGINEDNFEAASGGIWGRTTGVNLTITNATNEGLVNGSMCGGILGMGWESNETLESCVNNGSVVAFGQDAAGIIGRVQMNSGSYTHIIRSCTNNGIIVGKSNVGEYNSYIHGMSFTWEGANYANGLAVTRSKIVRVSQMSDISDSYDAWGAYVLVSDITWDSTKDFHGQLFGNGYTISTNVRMFNNTEDGKMYVEDVTVHMTESITSEGDGAIMFNAAFAGYAIKNVHFTAAEGATLTAGNNAGAVAAYGAGGIKVIGCVNEVDITAGSYVGGIFGNSCNAGVALTDCINYGDLSGCEAGGMIGRHYGNSDSTVTVASCSNYGTLYGTTEGTGGMVGHLVNSTATFTHCYNYGDVTNSNTAYGAGGIIGTVNDYDAPSVTVTSCHNSGTVTGGRVGGIIGYACNSGTTTVSGCTNTGSIVSTGGDRGVGGIMGYAAKGTTYITDCTNNGTVDGSAVTDFSGGTGGILGTANDSWPTVTISGCVNNGTVIGGNMAGGIVGSCYYTYMTISDCTNTASVSGSERVGGIIGSSQFGGSVTASNVSDTGSGLNLVGYIHVDVTVSGL